MNVLVTGSSQGIGRAVAVKFLKENHDVTGLDLKSSTIQHPNYYHYIADLTKRVELPTIHGRLLNSTPLADILINNAGSWDQDVDNMEANFWSTLNCTEEYGLHPGIKAIVNIASASAHNGAEFPVYAASKGAVLAYTKWTASEIAKYGKGATCNSISPGGVMTRSNEHILEDANLWRAVQDETLLGQWASPDEIAEWVYFVAVVNKSMTAQDILIDNGEMAKFNFVW